MQTLDETAISGLSLAAELSTILLTNVMKEEQNGYVNTRQVSKAKFTWVLRDFVLEIKDQSGRNMSENEYLESRLNNFS